MQERMFNLCNDITRCTSNRQGSQVINNILIRMTEESDSTATTIKSQEGEVTRLASTLPPFPNTIITNEWVKKHPYLWQAHLERIADFLIPGEGIWWRQHPTGMEFLDGPQEACSKVEGPLLHSFRTSNLKDEETYLTKCWKTCIDKQVPLPLLIPRVYNEKGQLVQPCDSHLESSSDTVPIASCNDNPSHDATETEAHATSELESLKDVTKGDQDDEDEIVINVREVETREIDSTPDADRECGTQMTSNASEVQMASSSSVTPPSASCYEYQTKLGKQLSHLLGNTTQTQRFDALRDDFRRYKATGQPLNEMKRRRYDQVCQHIKDKLVSAHTLQCATVTDWEKEYMSANGRPPNPSSLPHQIACAMVENQQNTSS